MTKAAVAPKSFRQKIFTSARLSALNFASTIGLRLVSTVILTRLLAPEIYGVFAIILVYRHILEMFSDLGLRTVILTKEDIPDDTFLRTCWTVSLIRGGVIALISGGVGLVIFALQEAGVFGEGTAYTATDLPLGIAVLGLASTIAAAQSMNRYMYERDMQFGRVTTGFILANLTAMIVTIVLAFWLRSVWALVFGSIFHAAFQVAYSYLAFHGARMGFELDRAGLRLIVDRSRWIIGQSALTAIVNAADRLMLGLVMSSATFGFYYIARQLIDMVLGFLQGVHGQMGIQVFGHIGRATPETFRRNYYKYRLIFDVLTGLAAGGLFMVLPLLVDIVFDDRYQDVAGIAQIIVFGLLLFGPLILREFYTAQRQFRTAMLLTLLSAATLWGGLSLAIWGLQSQTAALFVVALYRLPEVLGLWWLSCKSGWLNLPRELLPVLFFAIGTGLGWIALQIWSAIMG